jgi:hypothetical protein
MGMRPAITFAVVCGYMRTILLRRVPSVVYVRLIRTKDHHYDL